jgi:Flp pilus assembly protein CpaB
MNANNTLELFQFTQPVVPADGFVQKTRQNADKQVVGLSLTLESRRDAAKRLQLPTKSSALDEAILATSNRIKEIGIGEALKMAASPEWTGARVAVTRNKAGVKRFTLALMSVADKRTVTKEQIVKALAGMTEDEQVAILEEAEAQAKGQKAIEA